MIEKRSHPASAPDDDDSEDSSYYSPSVPDDNNGGREYSIPLRSLRTSHANLHAHRADLSQAPISDLDLLQVMHDT